MVRNSSTLPVWTLLAAVLPMLSGYGGDSSPSGARTPTSIVVVEGANQRGEAGRRLQADVVVEVRSSTGSALGDVPLSFSSGVEGGTVHPTTGRTDAAGRATTSWTLGTLAGEQALTVKAGELSATVMADALPGPPTVMTKSGGDAQSGEPGGTLLEPLEVTVTDDHGNPVPQVVVSFTPSAGSINPSEDVTDALGHARTTLTLPDEEMPVTVDATGPGLLRAGFAAVAERQALGVASSVLPNAHLTVNYFERISASGGSGSGYVFAVESGELPPGMELSPDGVVGGKPSDEGSYGFTVTVADDQGEEAAAVVTLTVCGPPLSLLPGESVVLDPAAPGTCGFFLPAGAAGDRYRIGAVRTTSLISAGDVQQVRLHVSGRGVTVAPPSTAVGAGRPEGHEAFLRSPAAAAGLRRAVRFAEATAAAHLEMRARELELVRTLGSDAVLRPRVRDDESLSPPAAQGALPNRIRADTVTSSCSAEDASSATFLKIGEDARLAVYQDSAQNSSGARVSADQVQGMLDFYRDHGKEVVDSYFGGITDVDGNGRIIVLITPAVSGNVAAFVWGGDFFPASGAGACRTSNEGEYIYFSAGQIRNLTLEAPAPAYQILVHEAKHVSSVYQRLQRGDPHPGFVEEGTAEIAGEVAVRRAWAAQGGPPVHARLVEQHWRDAGAVDNTTIGLALMLYRTQGYLASQPNAVVVNPVGAGETHSIYGSGWTFHRWLGDAYGGAGLGPMADSALFRRLNDQVTAPGIDGIVEVTGQSWQGLLEEFALAAMANGQPVPEVDGGYTGYDFRSGLELFCFAIDSSDSCDTTGNPKGTFPWPVTTDAEGYESRDFRSASYIGPIGPAGLRVHDLVSNGTGTGAEIHVEGPARLRLVVLRLH